MKHLQVWHHQYCMNSPLAVQDSKHFGYFFFQLRCNLFFKFFFFWGVLFFFLDSFIKGDVNIYWISCAYLQTGTSTVVSRWIRHPSVNKAVISLTIQEKKINKRWVLWYFLCNFYWQQFSRLKKEHWNDKVKYILKRGTSIYKSDTGIKWHQHYKG